MWSIFKHLNKTEIKNECPPCQVECLVKLHECVWTKSEDPDIDDYTTGCGQEFLITNENPLEDQGFKFFCYCGGKLVSP
jgi:hypothetical protein